MSRAESNERQRALVATRTKAVDAMLRKVLEQVGCEAVSSDLESAAREAPAWISLAIVEIGCDLDDELRAIAAMRRRPDFEDVPLLAITSSDVGEFDLWQLRALGISGLMHAASMPEHVRFRVGQLVHVGAEGRRHPRCPCCLPVEVDVSGEITKAWAISMSEGGLGLITKEAISPNTAIDLRFELEGHAIEAAGRTVSMRRARRPDLSFEVGLFFHRIADDDVHVIRSFVADVTRRWTAMEAVSPE